MDNKSVIKFCKFAYNFDSSLDWIDQIDWTCNSSHIKEKFRDCYDYCGNAGVMVYFVGELDNENQRRLFEYIDSIY